MDLRNLSWREETPAAETERLLESHYGKLRKWAMVLTRGDAGKAEEIVQEFCLYISLAKPDLRSVANLDGYFYTCLRNLYQSSLARSAREAMCLVSVAEFDSIRFALAGSQGGGDTLQRQNELRRICGYAVWRKDQSKSFCYFILHFFHGYLRSEVAAMSGVPLSAIYNKLRAARTEMKAHLEEPGRLRIVTKDTPPEPVLLWHQISTADLFKELRATILQVRNSDCLKEEDLLAHYGGSIAKPLPCSLLSHLVSCERCLDIVDRHFRRPTLESREPLDGTGPREGYTADRDTSMGGMNYASLLRTIRGRLEDIYEHRPATLSIAVNGRIVALHDIQGKHSTLAARIESSEKAQFVEVFSEQDVRFALLPVGEAPPDGPHTVTQRVELSDERWLELNLIFDGLGLNSEVAYFDPVLAIAAEEADAAEEEEGFSVAAKDDALASGALPQGSQKPVFTRYVRWLRAIIIPSSAMAWALTLMVVISIGGYWSYRRMHSPMDAKQALNQSIKLETAALQGQTEHQVLQLEKISATGSVLERGTVDVLKDGAGDRYIRRLYDSHHHLLAAEWRVKSKTHSTHAHDEPAPFSSAPWGQDISARAFGELAGREPELRTTSDGYELTVAGPTQKQPYLVSATLALNRRLLPIREVLRLRRQEGVYEVRFVQTGYSYSPSRSVPDESFEPKDELLSNGQNQQSSLHQAVPDSTELAELEIAALYQLNQMDADTGEPIEVLRAADGHVRIFGAIAGDDRRKELVSRLDALPNHRLLDVRITSQGGTGNKKRKSLRNLPGAPIVYEVGATKPLADPIVRGVFKRQGLSGAALDSSVAQFSANALTLSQHALQNAYALERLGSALSDVSPGAISRSSQEQWAKMVEGHSALLDTQIHSLNSQLTGILPVRDRKSNVSNMPEAIDSAAQFAHSAKQLLKQVQSVNHDINLAFASGAMQEKGENAESLLESTLAKLPMQESAEIANLARHLSNSGRSEPQEYSRKSDKPVTQ